jgi:hypothetical protein
MNARMRIAPPQREQTSGSTSYTCLINRAQARLAANGVNGRLNRSASDPLEDRGHTYAPFPRPTP